ncbi:MAG: choice-of-anchor J domain-containing protein [Hyphomicrobiales bacterium]
MKKIYLFLSLLFCTTAFAQERSELREPVKTRLNAAKDFTITDINDKSHNLYEYLNQGKFVVIDLFATWCPPCWSYHNSKALEKLYNEKGEGEGGTKEFIVIAIEADTRTNANDLAGTGQNTKGNWLEGTLYPMCDITQSNGINIPTDYNLMYYPTILMIAPNANKDVKEVGALATVADFVKAAEDFVMDDEAPKAVFNFDATIIKGSEIDITNDSEGIIDTYKWTFEGGTPATSTEKNPTVAFETAGVFEITLEVTNSKGSHKDAKSVAVLDPAEFNPFVENFERIGAFTETYAHWKSVDLDKKAVFGVNNFDYANESSPVGFLVFNPSKTSPATSMKCKEGSQMGVAIPPSDQTEANDWMISPKLKMEKSMAFKFWAQSPVTNYGPSKFAVYVSTTDDNPNSFVKISEGKHLTNGADWTEFSFDLSEYEGKDIHVAINNVSKASFFFFIDDLRVISAEGIDEVENKTKIFPVPSNEMVYVSSEYEFEGYKIYNQLGQLVLQREGKAKAFNVNISELDEGVYFIHLAGEAGKISKRIIVQ